MGEKTKFYELRTAEGQVILRFSLVEKGNFEENNFRIPVNTDQEINGKEVSSPGNIDLMTEAQKRYLFRILADHGIQREMAHQELKNAFRVNRLSEVSKFEASKMIERLLGEGIGGLKNGIPLQ